MAKYSKKAAATVERAMKKRKAGTLKSGGSGETVKSRKQAIAIGLSEARADGKKVPKKTTAKKTVKKAAKKTAAKEGAKKKEKGAKKSTVKKSKSKSSTSKERKNSSKK